MTDTTLYYVHDPMCSWCWGFRPTWTQVCDALDDKINIRYVVGGLAPDSDDPMPEAMQQMLQQTWRTIQARIPGTEFNFDFWTQCRPRRSTYPACRAVLAAKSQDPGKERLMISGIQQAYYLHAKNPSDDDVLIEVAGLAGLNTNLFAEQLHSDAIHTQLHADIALGQQLGAQGFPSMILVRDGSARMLQLDYNSADNILNQVAA